MYLGNIYYEAIRRVTNPTRVISAVKDVMYLG